jgi:hypothetical protein
MKRKSLQNLEFKKLFHLRPLQIVFLLSISKWVGFSGLYTQKSGYFFYLLSIFTWSRCFGLSSLGYVLETAFKAIIREFLHYIDLAPHDWPRREYHLWPDRPDQLSECWSVWGHQCIPENIWSVSYLVGYLYEV